MTRLHSRVFLRTVMLGVLSVACSARAATFDVGSGQTYATVADAIAAAGDGVGDVINIVDAEHTEHGVLVDKDLTIQGQGAEATIVQAHADPNLAEDRVFTVLAGKTVTIRDMTIRHGKATGEPAEGGGVKNAGTLTLTNVVVTQNRAQGDSGSVHAEHGFSGRGGGIHNTGEMTITDSAVSDNIAKSGGESQSQSSTAEDAHGGGIYDEGQLTINNSTVSGNTVVGGYAYNARDGLGGGIYSIGELTVTDVAVSDNVAQGGSGYGGGDAHGGGVCVGDGGTFNATGSTLSGNDALGGNGNRSGPGKGGGLWNGGTATLTDTTVADNACKGESGQGGSGGYGGGVHNEGTLTVSSGVIRDNEARGGNGGSGGWGIGGGAHNAGTLTITNTTISGNLAAGGDGGSRGGDGYGGGIANDPNAGTLVRRSTLNGNTATGGTGSSRDGLGKGGGVSDSAWGTGTEAMTLVNCTISDNTADDGGGVYGSKGVSLTNCTVAHNTANLGGGVNSGSTDDDTGAVLTNTIIANNGAIDAGPDIYDRVQSRGYNLIEDTSGGTVDVDGGDNTGVGNLTGEDPLLGALADNGGATRTHALQPGSPADDQIPAGTNGMGTSPIDEDQRGELRATNGTGDIGAYELRRDLTATMADDLHEDGDNDGQVDPGDTIRYTVAISNDSDLDAAGVVFSVSPDPDTLLVVGSVTASQGTVTTGNAAGDATAAVDIGAIATGAAATVTFDVTVGKPFPAGDTEVSAQGTVSSTDLSGVGTDDPNTVAIDDATATEIIDAAADVAATMRDALQTDNDGDGQADPGDTIRYTVTVTNSGNQEAMDVGFLRSAETHTTLRVGTVTTSQGHVLAGNATGDSTVWVDLGVIAEDGGTATVTFDVAIDDPMPDGVAEVSSQGTVNGRNFNGSDTDDPDTGQAGDPTATAIQAFMLAVLNGTGSGNYMLDEVVPIEATVPAGSRFDRWTGDTENMADPNAASTTVTMKASASVTATFVEQYTLNVAGGTGSGSYDPNQVVPIEATVPAGSHFDRWTGDTENLADPNAASTTVTMVADTTLIATFVGQHVLTVTNGTGSGSYDPNEVVPIEATVPADEAFDRWTGDTENVADPNATSTTVTMAADTSVTATFAGQFGLTVTGGTGSGSYDPNEVVTVQAAVPAGSRFDKWTGDTENVTDPNAASTTVTMKGDVSLRATFIGQYTLLTAADGQGEVSTDPNAAAYDSGAEVSLTATPADGWLFVRWEGDVPEASPTDNPLTLTMDRNRSVTATFSEMDSPPSPAPTDSCCCLVQAFGVVPFASLVFMMFGRSPRRRRGISIHGEHGNGQ